MKFISTSYINPKLQTPNSKPVYSLALAGALASELPL